MAPELHTCTLLQVAFEGQMTELRQLLEADAKLRQLRRQVAQQLPGSPLRRSMSSLARNRVTWTPNMVRTLIMRARTSTGCIMCMMQSYSLWPKMCPRLGAHQLECATW